MLVLFDDCHRPYPKLGKQPLPVRGVHNSGWKQSPGMAIVHSIHDKTIEPKEIDRLKKFVQEILSSFGEDQRILMWDLYNEPGQFGVGEKSYDLLSMCWDWAHEIRPSQPLFPFGKKLAFSLVQLPQTLTEASRRPRCTHPHLP